MKIHPRDSHRGCGFVGALIQLGLIISDVAEPDGVSFSYIYLVIALLFLATAVFGALGPFQALLFLCLTGVETVSSLNCFYGLGFAIVALLMLFRKGWFVRRSMVKASIIDLVGCVLLVLPIALSAKPAIALVPAAISATTFTILVFGLAKGRFLSSLIPKKPVLKLSDFNLNRREHKVVLGRLSGLSNKELVAENGVTISTIRNAFSTAYRKLGIFCSEDLIALGERYRVE